MKTEASNLAQEDLCDLSKTSQSEVQSRLEGYHHSNLIPVLQRLQSWSEKSGYFDHLTEENEYFTFHSDEGYDLRLQVNYSRLGYKKPDDPNAPDCPLCIENIGIKGKEKLRVFEFELSGRNVFIQLTPFPLYPGHFVLNDRQHHPMTIDRHAFELAAEFLAQAPGYLAASNSDVEWAGASVLNHHHLQVFSSLKLPIETAPSAAEFLFGKTKVSVLKWPCAAIRVSGPRAEVLNRVTDYLTAWKKAAPQKCTCNFIMCEMGVDLEVTMILRHPAYRTDQSLRHIKAEGVGVIEMCGEAIVPPIATMNRDENQQFFQENGKSIVQGIISQNGPRPDWLSQEWLGEFVTSPEQSLAGKSFQ